MISLRFQISCIILLVIGLFYMIRLIKKSKLELKYAITWLILDVGLVVIVSFPKILTLLAKILGIYDVTNMVFFVGFAFSIILNFTLTMSISRNSDRVRKLTQQIALNEYEINDRYTYKRHEKGNETNEN